MAKFSYQDYEKSDAVKQAEDKYQRHQQNMPGDYSYSGQDALDTARDQYLNREGFRYNINEDALYQQYKDQYVQQGKMAMMDTMGQAAAMTGGYGNSYAQGVGQQAYQGYLQQLNAVVPELYGMALDKYNQEGQDMLDRYGMLLSDEEQAYSRYQDSLNAYYAELDRLAEDARYQQEDDYAKYLDQLNMAYTTHRDDVADSQWQQELAENQRQYNASLAEEQRQYDESLKTVQAVSYADMSSEELGEVLSEADGYDSALELAWQMIEAGANDDAVWELFAQLYDEEDQEPIVEPVFTGGGGGGGALRQIHVRQ